MIPALNEAVNSTFVHSISMEGTDEACSLVIVPPLVGSPKLGQLPVLQNHLAANVGHVRPVAQLFSSPQCGQAHRQYHLRIVFGLDDSVTSHKTNTVT